MEITPEERGFTLIELLVVIAIIGLLSSIILASLNSARAKARDARRLADIRQISTALELYYSDHNAYPTKPAGPCSNPDYNNVTPLSAVLSPSYMSAIPADPRPRSCEYNYFYSPANNLQGYTMMVDLETNNASIYGDHWCIGASSGDADPLGLRTAYIPCNSR